MALPVFPTLPGLTFTVLKTPEFDTLVQSAPNKYEVRIQQTINPVWSYTLIYDFLHDFFWGTFTSVSELRTMMGFFLQMGGKAKSFLFLDPDDNYVGPALATTPWKALTAFPLNFGILDSANHWQKVTAITTGFTGAMIPTFNHSGSTTTDAGITWTDQGAYTSAGFPNEPLAQLQLLNDGAGNYYSPLQRTLDGVFYEDVTDLNTSANTGGFPLAVFANGSATSNYTVLGPGLALPTASFMGMYLKWNAMPTGPITAQFGYYFRVRFDTDSQDFEKWCNTGSGVAAHVGQGGGIYTIGGSEGQNGSGMLKLYTARPNPL